MRVAVFVGEFPSVSQTFILNQITGLVDRGQEVDIFTLFQGDLSQAHGDVIKYKLLDRVCRTPLFPRNKLIRILKGLFLFLTNFHASPAIFLRSLNIFKYGKTAASLQLLYHTIALMRIDRNYDIIHCHFGPNGIKAAALRDIGAIRGKLITTFHGYDAHSYPQQNGGAVYEFLFKKGELFLTVSEYMKRRLYELGCAGDKIEVHYSGVGCRKPACKERRFKTGDKIRILTIARLVEKKGIEYGIRAVSQILRKYENIEYTIIGDGPLRGRLKELIRELQADANICLAGWKVQDYVHREISQSDILLCPSVTAANGDQEGVPVVIMEAMAAGLPVISSRHSGISELMQDGVTGFLVPERDESALADKLSYLIGHHELWAGMGRTGRNRVESCHDIDKLNDGLIEIYKDTIVNRNSPAE